jgi:hypothetical protein
LPLRDAFEQFIKIFPPSTRSINPRAITEMGLCSTNRSKILPNICATSMDQPGSIHATDQFTYIFGQ